MTKQPHSATKLRLSKLFRWLAVLCFMKLTILGMLLLDVPAPSWLGGSPRQEATNQESNKMDAPAKAESAPRGVQQVAEAPAPAVSSAQSGPAQSAPAQQGLAQNLGSSLSAIGSALDSTIDSVVTAVKDKT